jgi:hypothetical protein
VNIDIGWPRGTAGNPDPADLLHYGIRAVRFVSRPGRESRIEEYRAAGIMTLGIVTAESAGYLCGADVIQIGNEPNLPDHGDALTATGIDPDRSFAARLQLFRRTYIGKHMIAGGIANWGTLADRVAYVTAVRYAGGFDGYAAVAVHYPPSAGQVTSIARAAGLPCWVTEWSVPVEQMAEYMRGLRAVAPLDFPFGWDDAMVPSFGFDEPMKLMLAAARG